MTASLSFDTSVEGLLWALAGHEVHIVDDDVRRDPQALVAYLAEHRVDFLDITLVRGRAGRGRPARPHRHRPGGADARR
ncbi:hypothetical protein ACFQ0M_11870 [Kitasatospora aburaviensis]